MGGGGGGHEDEAEDPLVLFRARGSIRINMITCAGDLYKGELVRRRRLKHIGAFFFYAHHVMTVGNGMTLV